MPGAVFLSLPNAWRSLLRGAALAPPVVLALACFRAAAGAFVRNTFATSSAINPYWTGLEPSRYACVYRNVTGRSWSTRLLASAISWTSSFKRSDEDTVPSWPAESMNTGIASALPVVVSRMPAIKVFVWIAWLPKYIVFDSPATLSTTWRSRSESPPDRRPKISPGNPATKPDGTVVRTLWGELAWQLGGKKAFNRIAKDDEKATSQRTQRSETKRFRQFDRDVAKTVETNS